MADLKVTYHSFSKHRPRPTECPVACWIWGARLARKKKEEEGREDTAPGVFPGKA